MNHEANSARTAEEQIDATLRAVGTASPEAGLQGRILNRLAAERIHSETAPAGWAELLHRMPRFAGAALVAVFVCVAGSAIVIGSVDHSRGLHHAPIVAPPVPGLPGNGIGAASAVHPAAPVSVPVPATQSSRGRSGRSANHGRARIQRHAHKAAGIAVPAPVDNSPK
ncbi:MAG TPA: hypothetical protein VGG42_00550 [Acidobacteriaceae bacterium]|jgi:hypothetical protein